MTPWQKATSEKTSRKVALWTPVRSPAIAPAARTMIFEGTSGSPSVVVATICTVPLFDPRRKAARKALLVRPLVVEATQTGEGSGRL